MNGLDFVVEEIHLVFTHHNTFQLPHPHALEFFEHFRESLLVGLELGLQQNVLTSTFLILLFVVLLDGLLVCKQSGVGFELYHMY